MKPTYSVKDWDKHFENHESRKVKRSYWVPIPNRHDGKSYRRIASHPEGVAVFAAWILILEAASKMPVRGVLADEDGPLDADDLASMTGFPALIFESAFKVLTEDRVGWLAAEEPRTRKRRSPGISRNLPESPGVTGNAAVEQNRTELQGTEGKDSSAKAGASATAGPSLSSEGNPENRNSTEFTIWSLAVGKLMPAGMGSEAARSFLGGLCKQYGKVVVADAVSRMLAQEPADPKAYLVGVLKNGASNGTSTTNSEFRRTTAAEKNGNQLARNKAVVERLRRQSGGDPDQVEGGGRTAT